MKKFLSILSPLCVMLLFAGSANALVIRVSQESAAGAGDFDANVLGTIDTYATGLSATAYYQYGSPDGSSYNGAGNGGPDTIVDHTINFFAETSDGLVFYNVHDSVRDGGGGQASMSWSLTGGDTAAFMVTDDDSDGYNPGLNVQGTDFNTTHRWLDCCTDGFGLGSIDGDDWALYGSFTSISAFDGGDIVGWNALGALGGNTSLNLTLNQRVRFDLVDVPEPSTLALLALGLIGFSLVRKK